MDQSNERAVVRGLADDFSGLEEHCRTQPELAPHAARLRLAAALTRNVVGPALEGQSATPLFIAVVGGAGAGKSTVVNFLLGSPVAEANPQAGYTRHPTAYMASDAPFSWPSYLGFLGPLNRLTQEQPANLDEDVYQVRRVTTQGANPLGDFVVWDCPDMTTWASTHYVSRLMEVVGLADVVIYVASDERYNDEIPTQFLHHVIRAGKAVVCCLTKAREAEAPSLVEHFRREVLGKLPTASGEIPPIPCVTLPELAPAVRSDPAGAGAAHRAQLINPILVLCPNASLARARTVRNAMKYLETAGAALLEVAKRDLEEIDTWKSLVTAGRDDFETRYQRDFLSSETFRTFDRTRDEVLRLLELPGPGRFLATALSFLRMPYNAARDFFAKVVVRPEVQGRPESVVCAAALDAWLDRLQAEALRRSDVHPIWKQIAKGFESGLKTKAKDRYTQIFRGFETKEVDELTQAAQAAPERLRSNPQMLGAARIGFVAPDVAAFLGTLWAIWPPTWVQLLLLPLSVSLTRQASELLIREWIETGRTRVRNRRESLVREQLSTPLAEWLMEWPSSGGSSLEKLQGILRRVPETIRTLSTKLASRPAPEVKS